MTRTRPRPPRACLPAAPGLALLAALLLGPAPSAAQDAPPAMVPRDAIVDRIAELRRIHTPEGIEELEELEVNGSRQWISIRGLNRANPVLLVLHGGPGSPVMGMAWAYQKPWEDFFTVVNWDQRGAGKSFSAADSARLGATLSPEQLADDAAVVVRHLRAKLGDRKIVLLGWSYGTIFGPLLVQRHPEWFAAWVPVGQTSGEANERELYRTLVERVRAAGDTATLRALEAMAPYPPPAGQAPLEQLLAMRRWAMQYDGGWYGKRDLSLFNVLPEWGPEYTAEDVANVGPAASWTTRHLINGRAHLPRPPAVESFEVPVVMIHGRWDLYTPYSGALAVFDGIQAPSKELVTFERSGHFPMFEEPGRFLMTLVDVVLPLAGGAASFEAH